MSTQITPARKIIYQEGSQFRGAVSEELIQRLGATNNFISLYQHSVKRWDVNGNYGLITVPFNSIDGYDFAWADLEIVEIMMYLQTCGTSGTTEFDIKYATASGGAWTSIFATTPKIAFGAGSGVWVTTQTSGGGLTTPVLSVTDIDAGSALRCDLIQAQSGTSLNGAGILLLHRPR